MANRIQIRRDNASGWTAANPILAAGEPAMETDTKLRKIGDGTTPWASLPYESDKYVSVIRPSGDVTGVADVAAINASLLANKVTILTGGTFNINAPIRQPSNTTLLLQEATVFLVNGSNCNVWQNYNQNATGDTNISIKGFGRASFNGNAAGQTRQNVAKTDGTGGTSMRDNVGIYPVNINGFRMEDVQIGPMNAYAMVMYGVVNGRISRVRLEQNSATTNQDGIDIGVGCQDVLIENVTGVSGDDAFCIMAIQRWRSTSPDTVPPAYQVGTALPLPVQDIVFRDCQVKAGINLIRILNDNTATVTRVVASNLKNSGRVGCIIFGPNSYVNASYYPAAGSISQVHMDDIVGGSSFSNTGYAIDISTPVENVSINNFETGNYGAGYAYGWKYLVGNAGGAGTLNISDVTVNGVHSGSTGTTNVGDVVKFSSTAVVSGLTLNNIKLAEANSITKNAAPISGLTLRNIRIGKLYGLAFQSADTGYFSDIIIDSLSGVTGSYGVAVGAKLSGNIPTLTAGDTAPSPVDGSRIRTDGTIDPNGGSDIVGGEWVGNGATWVKVSSKVDGWVLDGIAAPLFPAWYYPPLSNGAPVTMGLGDGLMRGGILIAGRSCTLTEIGLEVTTAGSAGSVLRLGLYRIPAGGSAANATLLVDAGTIDGTVVGYAGKTISQKVNAGDKLLLLAASQGAAATAPTVRGITGAVPYFASATALTASQNALSGAATTGVSGALPATTSLGTTGTVPRVLVKAS